MDATEQKDTKKTLVIILTEQDMLLLDSLVAKANNARVAGQRKVSRCSYIRTLINEKSPFGVPADSAAT